MPDICSRVTSATENEEMTKMLAVFLAAQCSAVCSAFLTRAINRAELIIYPGFDLRINYFCWGKKIDELWIDEGSLYEIW